MGRALKSDKKSVLARNRVRRYRSSQSNLVNQERIIQHRSNAELPNENENEKIYPAEIKLRIWALKHNVTRDALTDLLKILISIGLNWLPSDGRTLLETPQNIEIKEIANGKLWYHGIQNNLQQIFKTLDRNIRLDLNFNFDGLPLHGSTKREFRPILANIHGNLKK